MSEPKTYDVRTHGCQMNVHDSERLPGCSRPPATSTSPACPPGERPEVADVVVFNTCAVRENADNKLYGNLGQLRQAKLKTPTCRSPSAAAWRRRTAAPSSSARRGSTSSSAPTTSARCRPCSTGPATTSAPRSRSSSASRPSPRPCRPAATRAYSGWVSISVGCNNTCTFCIVPSLRGKEQDRRPGEVLAEIEALVAQGVSR